MSAEYRVRGAALGVLAALLVGVSAALADEAAEIDFDKRDDRVVITVGGRPLATYVFADPKISRPYFAHVRVPSGQQVTRNHPPRAGDAQDHATFHPGIWMAFGDISQHDYWRLKAKVTHGEFVELPRSDSGGGSFAVRNRYQSTDGSKVVCEEICRYHILVRPHGYLLVWDSTFSSEDGFYFGDQEEMGLGVRVATPLAVVNGGRIVDSEGRVNGKEVWGKQAKWCDYSGEIDGTHLGMTLMPHPGNFRQSWFHARDYGFVAANPFGVNAFTRGDKSKIVVNPGARLRLRFGVLLHGGPKDEKADLNASYQDFLAQVATLDSAEAKLHANK